jgi:hypothetical protein
MGSCGPVTNPRNRAPRMSDETRARTTVRKELLSAGPCRRHRLPALHRKGASTRGVSFPLTSRRAQHWALIAARSSVRSTLPAHPMAATLVALRPCAQRERGSRRISGSYCVLRGIRQRPFQEMPRIPAGTARSGHCRTPCMSICLRRVPGSAAESRNHPATETPLWLDSSLSTPLQLSLRPERPRRIELWTTHTLDNTIAAAATTGRSRPKAAMTTATAL